MRPHISTGRQEFREEDGCSALAVGLRCALYSPQRFTLHIIRPAVGAIILSLKFGRECHASARRSEVQMRWLLYRIANSSAWSKSTAPAEMSFLTVAAVL